MMRKNDELLKNHQFEWDLFVELYEILYELNKKWMKRL